LHRLSAEFAPHILSESPVIWTFRRHLQLVTDKIVWKENRVGMATFSMKSAEESSTQPTQKISVFSVQSIQPILEPIARALLRQGITAHEFSRWAEIAFVHAAIDVLNQQGKDPSFSRISAATGIHRHAVSSILGGVSGTQEGVGAEKEYQRHRLARVLTGWFENPTFTDSNGRPLPLKLEGDSPSFAGLVREYSGDIYPGIILDELTRVGAARKRDDGLIEAISRRFTSGGIDEASIQHACVVAADVLRTVEHNMQATSDDRLYEDNAIALHLPVEAIPRLARMLEQRAGAFLDDFEGWLSELQQEPDGQPEPGGAVRAGVRVIMVTEDLLESPNSVSPEPKEATPPE
jgi:hypothetical protein